MNKVVILLANGFEEIEALAPFDVLTRLNYDVELISMNDSLEVSSSHGVKVFANALFSEELYKCEGVIIPGGLPGATNLRSDERVIELVKDFNENNKLIAAICAGPIVLGKARVLDDKDATCYPGFEESLNCQNYLLDNVVVSKNAITSRGPATAFEFAFAIAKYLKLDVKEIEKGMLFK